MAHAQEAQECFVVVDLIFLSEDLEGYLVPASFRTSKADSTIIVSREQVAPNFMGWKSPGVVRVERRTELGQYIVSKSKHKLERMDLAIRLSTPYCAIINAWKIVTESELEEIGRKCRCRKVMECVPILMDGEIRFYLHAHDKFTELRRFEGTDKSDPCPLHSEKTFDSF